MYSRDSNKHTCTVIKLTPKCPHMCAYLRYGNSKTACAVIRILTKIPGRAVIQVCTVIPVTRLYEIGHLTQMAKLLQLTSDQYPSDAYGSRWISNLHQPK